MIWLKAAFILTTWDGLNWSETEADKIEFKHKPIYSVFLTEPVNENIQYLTCTFNVSGNESYTYRGQDVWNTCPVKANVRF